MTSIRASSFATAAAGSTANVAVPTGTAAGDKLLVLIGINNNQNISDNNGANAFTVDSNVNQLQLSTLGETVSLYVKDVTSGDLTAWAGNLSFNVSGATRLTAIAIAVQDPAATFYDVVPANTRQDSATSSATAPSITTTTANAIHVALVVVDGNTTTISSTPSGYTVDQNGGNQAAAVVHKTIASAGSTGAQSFGLGSSQGWIGVSFAIAINTGGGSLSPGDFQRAPEPRPLRAPVVADWYPLPAIAVASLLPGLGIQAAPVPATRRSPVVDNWDPLPALQALQASGGWGFSPGQQTMLLPPVQSDWLPMPGLPASTSSAIDSQSPVNRPAARASVGDWEPLGQLVALATPTPTLVEPQAPSNRPIPRAVVGDWEPLPQIASLAGTPATGFETSSPQATAAKRAQVEAWTPLASLPVTGIAFDAPVKPTRGRPPLDNWEPLPVLPSVAPSSFGYECAQPLNPRTRPPRPEAWEPLPALIALPVVPSGFECSTFLPRKARAPVVDAWEPLGNVAAAPALGPSVDTAAPEPRRVRTQQPDSWTPVASLGQPPLSLLGECQPEPQSARRAPTVDAWIPLPGLTVALVAFSAQPEPVARRRALPQEWSPLASIAAPPLPLGVFSDQPFSRPPRATAPDWEPLPALIPPPPVIPWADFASPLPRAVVSPAKIADEGSGWLTVLIPSQPFVLCGPKDTVTWQRRGTNTIAFRR